MSVVVYSSNYCPFCIRAKALLDKKGVAYQEVLVDGQPAVRQEMMQLSGQRTVPQIWIGDTHVGGCDELMALERSGNLEPLLASVSAI